MENSSSNQEKRDEVVAIDLPAPTGWKKKFIPKQGGTPSRFAIVFIAPSGEEIKTKRQLDQYLKSHAGGPLASEFDWGTGNTPRRSARLSEKSKAMETPESEAPKKKQKRSSSKDEMDDDDDDVNGEEEGESAEGKEGTDAAVGGAKDDENQKGEMLDEEIPAYNCEDSKLEINAGELVTEAAVADQDNLEDTDKNIKKNIDELSTNRGENKEASNGTSDAKANVENKQAVSVDASDALMSSELPVPAQNAEILKDVIPKVVEADAQTKFEDDKVGQEDHTVKEAPVDKVGCSNAAKPEKDSLKENQEAKKPLEDPSMISDEAPTLA